MKVNSSNNQNITFNGFWDSKALKKGLEFAANNGALFSATATVAFSVVARPISIFAAPKTDKENKKAAFAKSMSSLVSNYALMLITSIPIARGIKKIDKKPLRYLEKETVSNLKDGCEKLSESKAYSIATQMFKLGIGLLIACPKAILTSIGLPYVMQLFSKENPEENLTVKQKNSTNKSAITFKGKNSISKGISKIINNKKYQEFCKKYKDSNFPMHIMAATDALTTATFIHRTLKNDKLEKERNHVLAYNAFISTGLSILSSYIVDKLLDEPAKKFVEKFKEVNKDSPKLNKYLEGIKVAKPYLIAGVIYYCLIPFISTLLAERVEKRHAKG